MKSGRQSLLRKMVVKVNGPNPQARCIGCQVPVTPGMCYTGSIIDGMGFMRKEVLEHSPIRVTEHSKTEFTISGGDHLVTKRIGFLKRKKGCLCDDCAANYSTLKLNDGTRVEIVKTDPRPGFIGSLAVPPVERFQRLYKDEEKEIQAPLKTDNQWLNVGRKKGGEK